MALPSVRAVTRVLRLRIKDKHAPLLGSLATEVNSVRNYSNELSVRERRFFGAYELQKFTDGATKAGLSLHSHTVKEVGRNIAVDGSSLARSSRERGAATKPTPSKPTIST